jgi:integrase/recombinase XerD
MGVYSKGRGKTKSWFIDYRFPQGRSGKRVREKIGPDKHEAEIVLATRLQDIRQGRNPELRRIAPKSFTEMLEEFKQRHVQHLRGRNPYGVSMGVLKRHFGKRTLQEITPGVVQEFIAARLAEGVSKGTANRARACLSKIFSCAKAWGYFGGENPVTTIKPFRESPGRDRFLTSDEADALLAHAGKRVKPIILTMLHTGGRVSEVLGLRWSDVNLDQGVLVFDQSNTKSGKQREIPISPELADVLRQHGKVRQIAEARARRRARQSAGPDADRLVFGWNGKRAQRLTTAFTTARADAGLGDDVTPHVCRHTFASWFMINGGDLYRLQKYLGHSTIALTQRYAHLSREHLQAGVAFIGAPRKNGGHSVDTPAGSEASGSGAGA